VLAFMTAQRTGEKIGGGWVRALDAHRVGSRR